MPSCIKFLGCILSLFGSRFSQKKSPVLCPVENSEARVSCVSVGLHGNLIAKRFRRDVIVVLSNCSLRRWFTAGICL